MDTLLQVAGLGLIAVLLGLVLKKGNGVLALLLTLAACAAMTVSIVRLAEPVDAVICALDSLNYVTKPADCRKTFRRVYDALTPGGLFVFDINTPAKLRGLDGQVFLDETDDTYCVWRTEFDEKKRLCYYGMDIFRLEGEHWQRSFEEHIEYAYEPAELQQWLAEAGFTRIRSYGDRVLRAPKEAEQRIYFSAKKE